MSRPAYETALVRWVSRVLAPWDPGGRPVPVIFAGQRAARPALPYASVKALTSYGLHPAGSSLADDGVGGGVEVVTESSEGTASITLHGDNHDRMARTLKLAIYSPKQIEATRNEPLSASICFVVVQPLAGILRITEGDEGAVEDRSVIDVLFRFVDRLGTADSEYIDSAEATGRVAPDLTAAPDPSETLIVDITPP